MDIGGATDFGKAVIGSGNDKIRRSMIFGLEEPIISPQGVFVATRDSFEAVAHYDFSPNEAKRALFETLPLDEHGWCVSTAKISKAGHTHFGQTVWRLDKG